MKAATYLKKFGNKLDSTKNKKKFLEALDKDFSDLLVTHHAHASLKQFERAVTDLKRKWDGIGNKRGKELDPKLWNKFDASVISLARTEMHGHE